MCLAQGHNMVTPVGIKPRTSRSGVRRSTTTPPCFPGRSGVGLKIGKFCQISFISVMPLIYVKCVSALYLEHLLTNFLQFIKGRSGEFK